MGDSYASGVGAGDQPKDDTNRCFRFPNAYPQVMQNNYKSPKFNQVACSGNKVPQIKDKELLDKPESDGKYGTRPVWGQNPDFVTITMGGNDVGILNLVSTCILSFKLWGDDCDTVIQKALGIATGPTLSGQLDDLMKAIIAKGQKTTAGQNFKVYIVGYARFFNQKTTQCNNVTFKPSWNPLPPQYLTVERRTSMNSIAINLNKALAACADRFKSQGVSYISYDDEIEGHRFCDRDEPNPDDPATYFFAWKTSEDPALQSLYEKLPADFSTTVAGRSGKTFTDDNDYISTLREAAGDDLGALSTLSDSVRVMHPTSLGHQFISNIVLKGVQDGLAAAPVSPPTPKPNRCSLHLAQTANWAGDPDLPFGLYSDSAPLKYTVEVTVYDGLGADKQVIVSVNSPTVAGDPNSLRLPLNSYQGVLVITPEQEKDYIQFSVAGGAWWTSSDPNSCSVGNWAPPDYGYPKVGDDSTLGIAAGVRSHPANMVTQTRQMDCSFDCTLKPPGSHGP